MINNLNGKLQNCWYSKMPIFQLIQKKSKLLEAWDMINYVPLPKPQLLSSELLKGTGMQTLDSDVKVLALWAL